MHVHTRFAVLRPALVAWALLATVTVADAQWQWRDKSGQVTASDRPPPKEIPDKDILRRPNERRSLPPNSVPAGPAAASASAAASAPTATGPKSVLEAQVEARKKAAEQELAAKTRAEEEKLAQVRADNCKRARNQVATLDSGQRMARVNDKGEREVLDDKARADEMRRAREVIASDCRSS